MIVVGVDACKTGWIAVVLRDETEPSAHYLPAIDALSSLVPDADSVAIDIPIGLPTGGHRQADLEARAFVGKRRNSVFLTPVREAIVAETHALASRAAFERTGAGVSQQAYALGTKMLEVERWLPSSPSPVYEVHPEVSFAVLLGAPALAPKKTWAGMVQRRHGLAAQGISLDEANGAAAIRASVDDMLDAAVAAWTARRIVRGKARSFPDPPLSAAGGRPIAIWA